MAPLVPAGHAAVSARSVKAFASSATAKAETHRTQIAATSNRYLYIS